MIVSRRGTTGASNTSGKGVAALLLTSNSCCKPSPKLAAISQLRSSGVKESLIITLRYRHPRTQGPSGTDGTDQGYAAGDTHRVIRADDSIHRILHIR